MRAVGARGRHGEPHDPRHAGRKHQRRGRRGRRRRAARGGRRRGLHAVVESPGHPDGRHHGAGREEPALAAQEPAGPPGALASRAAQRATQKDAEQLIAVQCVASAIRILCAVVKGSATSDVVNGRRAAVSSNRDANPADRPRHGPDRAAWHDGVAGRGARPHACRTRQVSSGTATIVRGGQMLPAPVGAEVFDRT